MLIPLTMVFALALQDDISGLLDQLRGDDAGRREAAQRSLELKGLPVLDQLKSAAEKESDLETKTRLNQIILRIPRLAQLARVYGPAKRATIRVKNETLLVILENLGGIYGEKIINEGVDLKKTMTLDLRDVTLWEALDRVCRDAHIHYFYRKDGIAFKAGDPPAWPVAYYDQFRISVAEVKRIEFRSPDDKRSSAMVMLEVAFPRTLTPTGGRYEGIFSIDGMPSAAGADARTDTPWWANFGVIARRDYALEGNYTINAAAGSFSVTGKATVNFAQENREFTFPLEGERKEQSSADGTFKVASVEAQDGKTLVNLEIEVPDGDGPDRRFRGIWVVDADGKRHSGTIEKTGREGKTFRPRIWFPVAPDQAKTLVFKWAVGLHSIGIPFELRDIKIP